MIITAGHPTLNLRAKYFKCQTNPPEQEFFLNAQLLHLIYSLSKVFVNTERQRRAQNIPNELFCAYFFCTISLKISEVTCRDLDF